MAKPSTKWPNRFYFMASILVFHKTVAEQGNNYGVLYAESSENEGMNGFYCIMYNPLFKEIPESLEKAEKTILVNNTGSLFCEPSEKSFNNEMVAVGRGNCTFSQKATYIQEYGGNGIIIVSNSELSEPVANSSDDYNNINITVALLEWSDYMQIHDMGKIVHVQMYDPGFSRFDYNLILLWFIAVLTVIIGSYWSGNTKHHVYMRKHSLISSDHDVSEESSDQEYDDGIELFDISVLSIAIFVVCMCGMLVALYFFYDYLAYVIIALFVLGSSRALFYCLKPIFSCNNCKGFCMIPLDKLKLTRRPVELKDFILSLFCLGLAIAWAVYRNERYAWIAQDMLGFVFCIHMIETIRLPNFKICFILLMLLLFYDIFFVFITPLFTQSGESIMVNVATGSGSSSHEALPMVFKVPRLVRSSSAVCMLPYSLLGFGDVLVPGLCVGYCRAFDLLVKSPGIYHISCSIAYGIGILITYVALILSGLGQPALLYLVPCTVLTTLSIASCRGEFTALWKGELQVVSKCSDQIKDEVIPPVADQEINDDFNQDKPDSNDKASLIT